MSFLLSLPGILLRANCHSAQPRSLFMSIGYQGTAPALRMR
jgi:hypothetical protein